MSERTYGSTDEAHHDDNNDAADEDASTEIKAVPIRRPGRWIVAGIVLIVAVSLIISIVTNPRYQWDIVAQYFTEGVILDGLWLTLQLTVISMIAGIVLGVIFALMRGSDNPILARVGAFYIWFFRGTPLLVQLVFWFNISALYPELGIGIPGGPQFVSIDANTLVTPLMAGILGLALNEGAYMAEIVRGGILSINRGQYQAAAAIGMTRLQAMRKIVLPQAMRVIIPPTGNQTIAMLKNVALVSVLAIPDLLYRAQIIYWRNFKTIPLLLVACIWYLVCTTILTIIQTNIERHFSPDNTTGTPFLYRVFQNLFRTRRSTSAGNPAIGGLR